MLGSDRPDQVVDALGHFGSPHLDGELVRRAEYTRRLAEGETVDETRPLADAERVTGGYGAHCGLGDPGLTGFTCRDDLTCVTMDDPDFGSCLPAGERGAGDACEIGRMKAHRDPRRDRVVEATDQACARDGVCQSNRVGFPGGMCSTSCSEADDDEACGLIPALRPFNNCIGRGGRFDACILDTASPAAMRACDADNPCRDDYICARSRSERGVCMPPYFLFQLRVDGHVL
jgi:hypothetical protein